ncbi:restriction endonuclease [Tenacibaculum dicentrarchi]|uniref:restriction endonuclease n=1 Tax=Tenacibaculum dicentrarchi TaxID=669041 RepID=UPI0020363D7B
MFANSFHRNYSYSADDNILVLIDKEKIPSKAKFFIVSLINKTLYKKFDYGKQYRMRSFNETKIQLPTKNGKIDFDFMKNFINDLETERIAKLDAYLVENGLNDYELSAKEKQVLLDFEKDKIKFGEFQLENLFGKATRGRRLKSADRISGDLPFVTAGEANEGVSAFIGNNIIEFSENTTTIDMFGSAKYRNYKYGGDDHIAVVHTDKLPKKASIFVTSAIHKSSYNGQFNYGRNFYPKHADVLNISLPIKSKKPDYEIMETLISAIQKTVVKDVVLYVKNKGNC